MFEQSGSPTVLYSLLSVFLLMINLSLQGYLEKGLGNGIGVLAAERFVNVKKYSKIRVKPIVNERMSIPLDLSLISKNISRRQR